MSDNDVATEQIDDHEPGCWCQHCLDGLGQAIQVAHVRLRPALTVEAEVSLRSARSRVMFGSSSLRLRPTTR